MLFLLSCGGSEASFVFDEDVETRFVTDAFGEVEVPADPQRIVVVDEGTMSDLLALGVTPIAVHDWGRRDFTLFLNIDPEEIQSVGSSSGPNYEAILGLQPDLIISREEHISFLSGRERQRLEAIAPTVFSPAQSVDWQGHLTFIGEVVNKQDEAAEIIEIYDARLAEFSTAWAESGNDQTIGIVRSREGGLQIYAKESFISDTVTSAGLIFPEAYVELPRRNSISLEEIDTLDSDYLFFMVRNEDEAKAFVEASESPLWGFLPAVQNEQAYQVNWSVWVAGWNAVGAQLVLDDLFFFLIGDQSSTPNPFLAELVIPEFGPEFDVARFEEE